MNQGFDVRARSTATLAWLGVFLLSGCEDGSPSVHATGTGLSAELSREAASVMRLLGWTEVLVAFAIAGIGWAAIRLIQSGVVLAWQVGMDTERRLAPVRSAANVIILSAVAILLLRRSLVAAPVITLLALVVTSGAAALVLAHPIQNVWAGFVLAFRRRIRAGDRVTVAGQVGIVLDISLTQLHLRGPDGASIFIPNRVVLNQALRIEQAKNTEAVVVQVVPDARTTPETIKAVRRAALFSPFRVPGTAMDVQVVDSGAVQVTIQVWSGRTVREARIHLEARLQALLLHGAAADAPKPPVS
jgi:small-conductance mechanosensitive channel